MANADLHCWAEMPSCWVSDLHPQSYWAFRSGHEPTPDSFSPTGDQQPDKTSPKAPAASSASSQRAGSPSSSQGPARASGWSSGLTPRGSSPLSATPCSGWSAVEPDPCTATRLKTTSKHDIKKKITVLFLQSVSRISSIRKVTDKVQYLSVQSELQSRRSAAGSRCCLAVSLETTAQAVFSLTGARPLVLTSSD